MNHAPARPVALPLVFTLGLALGGSAVGLALRLKTTPAPPAPALVEATPAPWSWRETPTPAPLGDRQLLAAIYLWRDTYGLGSTADFSTRAEHLRVLLTRLPASAFPRLLDPLATAAATPDERRLRRIAFDAWIEADPAAAARWAATMPVLPEYEHWTLARAAFVAWAKIDASAAFDHALGIADAERKRSLVSDLLPLVAARDPAAAIRAYGPRLFDGGAGFWTLRGTLGAWSAQDPSAALAWLLAQPRKKGWDPAQWIGGLAATRDIDRAAYARALATVPAVPDRTVALGDFLSTWARMDMPGALAWLSAIEDRHLRNTLLERAAGTTLPGQPELNLPLLLAMSEGLRRTNAMADLLGRWAALNPSATLEWIRAHQDEPGVTDAGAQAHAGILGTIAQTEPATAVSEWNALPDGASKIAALKSIAAAWGRTDPAAALRWIDQADADHKLLSGNPFFEERDLVLAWVQKAPLDALRWAEGRASGPLRNNALSLIADAPSGKAPRAATADLYAQIQDPALRVETLTRHVREWLTKDPAAAKIWLESHDLLTPAQAAAFLAPAK